jgi:hypothetical protein
MAPPINTYVTIATLQQKRGVFYTVLAEDK